MSMNSSFIYGYGFNSDCDEEKLISFIKEHRETFCDSAKKEELYNDILDYENSQYTLEDLFENYDYDTTGTEGLGAVIANIMSRETGINFIYCQPDETCNTLASVVFEESYPWLLNKTEKELTQEELSKICKIYMDELGISGEPDTLALEYYS